MKKRLTLFLLLIIHSAFGSSHFFKGLLNEKYAISGYVSIEDQQVNGYYFYPKNKTPLRLSGYRPSEGEAWIISEYVDSSNSRDTIITEVVYVRSYII